MDISSYVRERARSLADQTARVRDFKVFDFSWVPEEPLLRSEGKVVIDAMLKFQQTGIPQNLVVLGSRGSGKTLMMRYLQRVLRRESELDILYGNCRNHNTSFKLVASFLGAPMRGVSLQELYEKFVASYPDPLVVILDEVDLISKKDPNKDILYFLSRCDRPYMVVCLSNNPRFLSELDASVRSSLQPEVLYFKNYDANQVTEILRLRAEKGLWNWDGGTLAKIAALTVQRTNSDVRVALKTLFYSVTGGTADVRESFDRAQRDVLVDVISDLNDRNLLILRAVQLTSERHVKKVFRTYEQVSEELGEPSFSYVYFLNNLSYMQSLGIVLLVQTKVNRAYTSTVSLLFNEQVLDSVILRRFR